MKVAPWIPARKAGVLQRICHFAVAGLALAFVLGAETVPGRYIVELSTQPVSDYAAAFSLKAGMRGAASSTHRARIRTEQQRVRVQLEQLQARVLDSVDTVANALFVEVSDAGAAQLAAVPGVKRVVPVRRMHLLLDRAIVLHNVEAAWNQIGADRAGLGVKIAIIDTGIESDHPAFQDSSLAPPDSFPRVNSDSDLSFTNGKIIVARSYVNLLPSRDPDLSARDRVGHGTALAMTAAGVRNAGPLATITGVAPKAYLGNYKVFGTPGYNDSASDDAILKAMDDAVADGMDIINLSLGTDLAPRLADDLDAQAIERAVKAGVIVVAAAGNNGPDFATVSSPATAPSAIAVGATTNDRTFAASVEVPGLASFIAIPGDGPLPSTPVSALLADVAAADGSGLACSALPAGALTGSIALILRGTCTFETKLNNAQRAGAVAGLVYAAASAPDPIPMAVGSATLPAEMISHDAGLAIQASLASQPSLAGTARFSLGAVPIPANRLTDFSAAGPGLDAGVKPDLTAVGGDIYVATQTSDPSGDMYDSTGYILVDGTSFSSPLVAGAAALVKSARPGLSVDQYRSLLINSAAAALTGSGQTPGVQQAGAGLLDVSTALRSTVTAYPVSLSFGAGGADPLISSTITITNIGAGTETFTIAGSPQREGPAPAPGIESAELAAGASLDVPVTFAAGGLAPGAYEGSFTITALSSGARIHVPYWYAATAATPARVTLLDTLSSARRGSVQRSAILFRITDASGVVLAQADPQVTVVSGGGAVRQVVSYDGEVPGMFGIDLQLGLAAGTNLFHIQAGDAAMDVAVTGR